MRALLFQEGNKDLEWICGLSLDCGHTLFLLKRSGQPCISGPTLHLGASEGQYGTISPVVTQI